MGAPLTVMQGQGAGIGPANNAVFWDEEWIAVDNSPQSPYFGRICVTATRFKNGLQGSYTDSPVFLSFSDDSGLTWTDPAEISGSHPSCTYQETGPADECDEDQFSNPVTAPDGTLYVYYLNGQNEAAWEYSFDFDDTAINADRAPGIDPRLPAGQVERRCILEPLWSVVRQGHPHKHSVRQTGGRPGREPRPNCRPLGMVHHWARLFSRPLW